MKNKYEVEMEVTKRYTVKVVVEGNFDGVDDPDIETAAQKKADNMSHEKWSYNDTEFEIQNVTKITN